MEKICGAKSEESKNKRFKYVWSLSKTKVFMESTIDCVTSAE